MRKIIVEQNALTTLMVEMINGEFTRYYIESGSNQQNQIIVGRVMQVVKNLEAAFVDFGDKKNGMLPFKSFPDDIKSKSPGMLLPVQVVRQNLGDKGHKLTAKPSISGSYLVCLIKEQGISISSKIKDKEVRDRLKKLLNKVNKENGSNYGFIVRTHALEASDEQLVDDALRLITRADEILNAASHYTKGTVVYGDSSYIKDKVRELITKADDCLDEIEIITNDNALYSYLEALSGRTDNTKITFNDEVALLNLYCSRKKIDELTNRKVWLKSGGNLCIDNTEAMTVIDVNSAKLTSKKNHDNAVMQLNKEAIKESILQILRRNISGIIIIDLVEIKSKEGQAELYSYAKSLLEEFEDNRTKVYKINELGLMQLSRMRKNQSIMQQLSDTCPCCNALYSVSSYLKNLMQLEEKLKNVRLENGKQLVSIVAQNDIYDKLIADDIINALERKYPVKININRGNVSLNHVFNYKFQ